MKTNSGLRNVLILFPLWLGVLTGIAFAADQCLECHSSWEEGLDAPSVQFQQDIHSKAGLSCASCHGGDPTLDDMDAVRKSKGYKGVPGAKEVNQFCASCHSNPAYMVKFNPSLPTDQLDKYKTSVHGKRLFEQGDTKVATCISCHTAHSIQPAAEPTSSVYPINIPRTCAKCHADAHYMSGYGITTDQHEKYIRSVHGRALLEKKDISAPACNDCHGNHGATPPGVTSLSAVCGLCHTLIADNFAKSPHKEAFDAMGYPECETCHSNHLIEKPKMHWVGVSDSSLCVQCHAPDDGTGGYVAAARIYETLVNINSVYNAALARIDTADMKGMLVTDERFALNEVKQAIIQTGTAVHTFDPEAVSKVAEPGITSAQNIAIQGEKKIEEYYFRRKGLGIATLLITILVIAIYLRIKSIEK